MEFHEQVFVALQPSNSLGIVFLLGLCLLLVRVRRVGTGLLALAALGYLALGYLPVGNAVLRAIEARTAMGTIETPPDGIIILGGAHPPALEMPDGVDVPLNAYGERLTAGAGLAARYKDARVILTDGGAPVPAAAMTAALMDALGVAADRLVVDDRARSTYDNAILTHRLVAPQRGERYLLVTSAWHMPRALATFRAAGWSGLIPYPVDFVTDPRPLWQASNGSAAKGLTLADLAARETLALAFYWLTGRMTPSTPRARP